MKRGNLILAVAVGAVLAMAQTAPGQSYSFNKDGRPYNPSSPYANVPTRAPATPVRPPTSGATVSPPTATQPPSTPYPYTYYPYYPYSYSTGGGGYYYYTGPLVIPADDLYGPEAVKRFMGVDRMNSAPAGRSGDASSQAASRARAAIDGSESNKPDADTISRRHMGLGNGYFSKQRYLDAYERYKKAAEVAPSAPEPFFRQGIALIALGRYELAAQAFQRGLELDPQWPRKHYVMIELYTDDTATKAVHLDALAQAAEKAPSRGDLFFLLGVCLACDGKPDRAGPFFQEAARLMPDAAYLKGLVGQ